MNRDMYDENNTARVPSIFEALSECLRGNNELLEQFPLPVSTHHLLETLDLNDKQSNSLENDGMKGNSATIHESPFYVGSVVFSPTMGPFSLLRKICYFFDILTKLKIIPVYQFVCNVCCVLVFVLHASKCV